MENEKMQSKLQWETPGMMILAMNEVTLGDGAAGIDFDPQVLS
ncbi:hypothetical protein [Chitinophaga sp. CF418]|nr:hypothetical protein [Chitinophaga sp. CF418]SHN28878.1 hypothetical protein SAMN05216311_108142 [Chitinophaga sp. CF418]